MENQSSSPMKNHYSRDPQQVKSTHNIM